MARLCGFPQRMGPMGLAHGIQLLQTLALQTRQRTSGGPCAHATLSARGHGLSCGHGVSLEGPGHGKTAKPVTRWHSRKLSEARIRAVQCYDVPLRLVTCTLCSARAPHRSDTQHRALEAVI